FDIIWLERAVKLSDYTIAHFYDEERKLFRYKSDLDEALIVSKFPVNDNVIPSGNSVMANNLFVLGNLFYEEMPGYLEMANGMLQVVAAGFKENPYYYYGWMPVFYSNVNGFYEIAIVGDDYALTRKSMQSHYIPDAIYLGGSDDSELSLLNDKLVEGRTYIYVCQNKFCKLPVDDPEKAFALIQR
ncbi:MAG: thioredoxin domain-containing protein, partial [Planctomycetes bacterium]|nr:thioredoxin domain-containing protein [Planctomycetota bacterium]